MTMMGCSITGGDVTSTGKERTYYYVRDDSKRTITAFPIMKRFVKQRHQNQNNMISLVLLLIVVMCSTESFVLRKLPSYTYYSYPHQQDQNHQTNSPQLYSSLEDGFQAIVSSTNSNNNQHGSQGEKQNGAAVVLENVMEAAAGMTQDSCQLLGIKSLGVDYGLVRTGIAVTVGYAPKPLEILSDFNNTQLCDEIVTICQREQGISRVILGLPLHKNGTEAEQTNLTRIFASELAQKVLWGLGPDVPVIFWDERYTSKEAAARLHARDPTQGLYGQLDADAACIILENYYNDNGVGHSELVQVPSDMLAEATRLWEENKMKEELRLRAAQEERDQRLNWRKQAMERDRQLEIKISSSEVAATSNKKKKKKKKKKK